jgi:hypothetical protein
VGLAVRLAVVAVAERVAIKETLDRRAGAAEGVDRQARGKATLTCQGVPETVRLGILRGVALRFKL